MSSIATLVGPGGHTVVVEFESDIEAWPSDAGAVPVDVEPVAADDVGESLTGRVHEMDLTLLASFGRRSWRPRGRGSRTCRALTGSRLGWRRCARRSWSSWLAGWRPVTSRCVGRGCRGPGGRVPRRRPRRPRPRSSRRRRDAHLGPPRVDRRDPRPGHGPRHPAGRGRQDGPARRAAGALRSRPRPHRRDYHLAAGGHRPCRRPPPRLRHPPVPARPAAPLRPGP